ALGLAAGKGVERLPQLEIAQTDVGQRLEQPDDLPVALRVARGQTPGLPVESERLPDTEIENVGDRFAQIVDVEGGRLVATPVAIGTSDVDVGEELHLHLLTTGTGTAIAAPFARIEGKEAGVHTAGLRPLRKREE